jgi:hypothetical protein
VAFDCSGEPDVQPPIEVVERSYSYTGAPFVVFEFTVINRGTVDIEDAHVGLFADFDVGIEAYTNLADFDDATNLLYVWDETGGTTEYYGMMALNVESYPGADVSGYEFDVGDGVNPTEAQLYAALTNGGEPPPVWKGDRRTVLGTGPYDIPAGGCVLTQFAFVAGLDEAGIIANAQAAAASVWSKGPLGCAIPPATEPMAEATGAVLHAPYPNPAQGATTLAFTLDAPQSVRLSVYDVLGREAAVLVEGERSAGRHAFDLDPAGAGLPAGVYVVRLEAGEGAASRRLTLVR